MPKHKYKHFISYYIKVCLMMFDIFITVILQHIVSNCSYHMKSDDNMLYQMLSSYKYTLLYGIVLPYIMLYALTKIKLNYTIFSKLI